MAGGLSALERRLNKPTSLTSVSPDRRRHFDKTFAVGGGPVNWVVRRRKLCINISQKVVPGVADTTNSILKSEIGPMIVYLKFFLLSGVTLISKAYTSEM